MPKEFYSCVYSLVQTNHANANCKPEANFPSTICLYKKLYDIVLVTFVYEMLKAFKAPRFMCNVWLYICMLLSIYKKGNTYDAVHYNNQVFTTTPSENFNSALFLALVCFKR